MRNRLLGKFLASLLVLVAILVQLHFILCMALGTAVETVFASGTGAKVSVRYPTIKYFPLRGSVRDVKAYLPSEGKKAGYKAKEIRVTLDDRALLSKRVILKSLEIDEAKVSSVGKTTAFTNLIEFLFAKRPKVESKGWLSFLTSGWRVWVPHFQIQTTTRGSDNLVIGEEHFSVSFADAVFIADDPFDDPNTPVIVVARGRDSELRYGETVPRKLGDVRATGTLLRGFVKLAGKIQPPEQSQHLEELKVTGAIDLNAQGAYGLSFKGALDNKTLNALITPTSVDTPVLDRARLELDGELLGELLNPRLEGQLKLSLAGVATAKLHEGCEISGLESRFFVDPSRVRLFGLRFQDLVQEGQFELLLDPTFAFQGTGQIRFSEDNSFLNRCLQSYPLGEKTKQRSKAGLAMLASTQSDITVQGELQPFRMGGALTADLADPASAATSRLNARFDLESGLLSLRLDEQESKTGSKGETEVRQRIDGKGHYNFADRYLEVERLQIHDYPLQRLVSMSLPFVPAEHIVGMQKPLTNNSLLNGQATFKLRVADKNSSGSGSFKLSGLSADFVGFEALGMDFSLSETKVELPRITLQGNSATIEGHGSIGLDGTISGTIPFKKIALSGFSQTKHSPVMANSYADGRLEIRGTLSEPTYEGESIVRLPVLGAKTGGDEQIQLQLHGDKEQFDLAAKLLGGRGQLNLRYPLFAEVQQLEVSAVADNLPLSLVLGSPSTSTSNVVSGTVKYLAAKDKPLDGQGAIRIDRLDFEKDSWKIRESGPIVATIGQGKLDFSKVHFLVDDHELRLTGFIDKDSGWHAAVGGSASLGNYLVSLPALEELSGVLALNLDLQGPLSLPSISGSITLADGALSFPAGEMIIGIHNASAVANFSGDAIQLRSFHAQMGEGTVDGQGYVLKLYDPALRQSKVEFQFKDLLLEPAERLTMTVGGNIGAVKTGDDVPKVFGDIEIEELLYKNTVNLAQFLSSLTKTILGKNIEQKRASKPLSEAAGATNLDLLIHADHGLVVDTNVAQAELQANLRVLGTAAHPRLDGKVSVIDGTFGFKSSQFTILNGELVFSERSVNPDPRINILSEASIRAATGEEQPLRLAISGTLTQPKLNLMSESGLSQSEMVSALGLGAEMGGIQLFGGNREERTIRELVSPGSDLSLRDRLSGLTGFRDVRVETALSRTTGEFVPKIAATRKLSSDFDLTISSELTEQQGSEFDLGYELTPYLTLLNIWRTAPASRDVNKNSGEYGLGVRYHRTFSGTLIWNVNKAKEKSFEQE